MITLILDNSILKEEVIKVENLKKMYKSKLVTNNVGFTVYKNDIFGILGPNGAGKSTIMKLLLSFIKKDSGKVYINGFDIDRDLKKAMNSISAIIESPNLYMNLTAYDNLYLMKNLATTSKYSIDEMLEIVGLKDRGFDKVKTYSLGMKQRLAIAMALIKDSKIIILDEPTNGLDPSGIVEIREIIKRLARDYDKTIIISSHQLHEIELICNRLIIIQDGKIIKEDSLSNLVKEEKKNINIISRNVEHTIKILSEIEDIDVLEFKNGEIKIGVTKNIELLNLLIEKGCLIDYFERNIITLEEKFMNIVGENNE